jgi:S-adenosylmethionine:tRNA ribosyltransferase-isomerase
MTDPGDATLYDYDLPPALIAQEPLEPRDASRLLYLPENEGDIRHLHFRDLPSLLRRDDVLVVNDTRVTARRLLGKKPTGGNVELLLMRRLGERRFEALCRPAKRLQAGAVVDFSDAPSAVVVEVLDAGLRVVEFESDPADAGTVPLPPYYHGHLDDPERYQTVYASAAGSAAAPTAGLHFTPSLLKEIDDLGVKVATVTLHIGLDTFRPMPDGPVVDHKLHGESFAISPETARALGGAKGRIIAVGTTSVRVLESLGPSAAIEPGERTTRLFITPGWRFERVSGMVTNFHLPRTTMLVMVCALAGRERVLRAYEAAIQSGYRFLSFGDAMLIL